MKNYYHWAPSMEANAKRDGYRLLSYIIKTTGGSQLVCHKTTRLVCRFWKWLGFVLFQAQTRDSDGCLHIAALLLASPPSLVKYTLVTVAASLSPTLKSRPTTTMFSLPGYHWLPHLLVASLSWGSLEPWWREVMLIVASVLRNIVFSLSKAHDECASETLCSSPLLCFCLFLIVLGCWRWVRPRGHVPCIFIRMYAARTTMPIKCLFYSYR